VSVGSRIGEVDPRLTFGVSGGLGVAAERQTLGGERAGERRDAGGKLGMAPLFVTPCVEPENSAM
jgi:hypothetical protein